METNTMMLSVMDMPKWKEKIIYLVLRLIGYGNQHFMLVDINDTDLETVKNNAM